MLNSSKKEALQIVIVCLIYVFLDLRKEYLPDLTPKV